MENIDDTLRNTVDVFQETVDDLNYRLNEICVMIVNDDISLKHEHVMDAEIYILADPTIVINNLLNARNKKQVKFKDPIFDYIQPTSFIEDMNQEVDENENENENKDKDQNKNKNSKVCNDGNEIQEMKEIVVIDSIQNNEINESTIIYNDSGDVLVMMDLKIDNVEKDDCNNSDQIIEPTSNVVVEVDTDIDDNTLVVLDPIVNDINQIERKSHCLKSPSKLLCIIFVLVCVIIVAIFQIFFFDFIHSM
jgi:thiamine pyrophosphate-dependent acetolactate synthase large subunit-like protein